MPEAQVTDTGREAPNVECSGMRDSKKQNIVDIVEIVQRAQENKRRQSQATAAIQNARKAIQKRKQFNTKHAAEEPVAKF